MIKTYVQTQASLNNGCKVNYITPITGLKIDYFFLNCINSSILKFQFFSIITGFYSRLNLLQAAGSTMYYIIFSISGCTLHQEKVNQCNDSLL